MDSFTLLKLNVFHTLWEFHYLHGCPQPVASMTKAELDKLAREEALRSIPLGIQVRKNLLDREREGCEHEGQVFAFGR